MNESLDIGLAMEEFEFTQDELQQINALELSFTTNISRNIDHSESDSEQMQIPKRKRHLVIASDTDSDSESVKDFVASNISQNDRISLKWSRPKRRQPSVIPFTEFEGMKLPYSSLLKEADPDKYYGLLVPEEIFKMIAEQTNLFASQNITAKQTKPGSRSHSWKPTNMTEIKKFLGLILYMGIVKLPKLAYYWSKDKILGQNFPSTVMSRNRFELLLQYLHFSDNLTADRNDRISKIRPIIDALNATFQKYYAPKEDICVDESQVPYRGRIIFRQYNKSKRHKYGMKLFKLCTIPGYTCKLHLYSGKNIDTINTTPTNVVMALSEYIFEKGHTLATDNWYTSLELAYQLLEKQTHLIGTLRKNRRGLPKAVIDSKLQKGETMAMENEDGITVLKWKDKRDVFMLSTKHSDKFAVAVKKGKQIRKPRVILDYNKSKGSVDMSDQMGAYSSPLRKTVKWYKKLAVELLLNTAVVNAWVMYTENKKSNISIVDFRRALIEYLIRPADSQERNLNQRPKRLKHELKRKEGKVRDTRRFCVKCYKDSVEEFGRIIAKNKCKKVSTYCMQCDGEPHYCLMCFNKIHRFQ
ncbi:unnamed protein product [Pieris macdunnoughi]|uniref:PiggyBac transposable element-derived protein domain-containing protein n=1 Tax=Pieris macdunnoughi TaxID=345717 RepID=A0A821XQU2_9NEOP|nr:unnamed protein product [Pieris macdunnoughi]